MADLTEVTSAGTTKIVGSDPNGLETNPVNADANGSIFTLIKDGTGNTITSTAVLAKQALDVNIVNSSGSGSNVNILGLNNIQTSQYVVGLTAIQITPSALSTRSSMSIKVKINTYGEAIYIGASNAVTTANGYPLFNGDAIQLDITPTGTVWAIAAVAGQNLYAIEVGS